MASWSAAASRRIAASRSRASSAALLSESLSASLTSWIATRTETELSNLMRFGMSAVTGPPDKSCSNGAMTDKSWPGALVERRSNSRSRDALTSFKLVIFSRAACRSFRTFAASRTSARRASSSSCKLEAQPSMRECSDHRSWLAIKNMESEPFSAGRLSTAATQTMYSGSGRRVMRAAAVGRASKSSAV